MRSSEGTKLIDRCLEKFRANCWEFRQSVINVIRYSGCPKDVKADPQRIAMKSVPENLLGYDEDGIATMMED